MRCPHVLLDRLQNTFEVLEDVVVPEPDDAKSVRFEPCSSLGVGFGALSMLSAVDFDDEALAQGTEIDDVTTEGMLAAKPYASDLAPSNGPPEATLGVGKVSS